MIVRSNSTAECLFNLVYNEIIGWNMDYQTTSRFYSVFILYLIVAPLLNLFFATVLYVYGFTLHSNKFATGARKTAQSRRALIVTAHPDDEVMFFGPTICGLSRSGWDVKLLCLSEGDLQMHGFQRANALRAVWRLLGFKSEVVIVNINDPKYGAPTVHWNEDTIEGIVREQLQALNPDCLITFDEKGITSHPNHIAVYSAVKRMKENMNIPRNCLAYKLYTVSAFRRFSSFVDVPATISQSKNEAMEAFISSPTTAFLTMRAALTYTSHVVNSRFLYIISSCYMYTNSLAYL